VPVARRVGTRAILYSDRVSQMAHRFHTPLTTPGGRTVVETEILAHIPVTAYVARVAHETGGRHEDGRQVILHVLVSCWLIWPGS
jgi:hypothetical protein